MYQKIYYILKNFYKTVLRKVNLIINKKFKNFFIYFVTIISYI